MRKSTTTQPSSKSASEKGFTYTILTGALLALLSLPTSSFADQQAPVAAQKTGFSSYATSTQPAENYGDINDEEDGFVTTKREAKPEIVSKRNTSSFGLMLALNDQDDGADGGYGDTEQDED